MNNTKVDEKTLEKKQDNDSNLIKVEEVNKDEKINIIKKIKEKYDSLKGIGKLLTILLMILVSVVIVRNSCTINKTFSSMDEEALRIQKEEIDKLKDEYKDKKELKDKKEYLVKYCKLKKYDLIFINGTLVLSTILIVYAVTRNPKISIISALIFWTVIDIANYVVYDLRGTPLAFADIYSISTAMAVSSGMKVEFEKRFYLFILTFLITLITISLMKFKKSQKLYMKIIERILAVFLVFILINHILNIEGFKSESYWNLEEKYRVEGLARGIFRQMLDINIKKPEGYSLKKVNEILDRYEIQINQKENVNVIVVINESFADLNNLYKLGIENNIPYFTSLTENSIKGTAYSSVYGGNTATAEWEFMTGNSAAFIPPSSIPFLVYIRNNKDTIFTQAVKQNYSTNSLHSFYGRCYNRLDTYSKMGLENVEFVENMTDYNCPRPEYTSDKDTYMHMINKYENRDKSKKFFGYILTMQNHLPYTAPEWMYQNKGYVKDNYELDQYLSSVNDSDIALKDFIEYFENEQEKTIILFFGDHQPNLGLSNKEEWLIESKVPYLLWANFDIEEKQGEDISFNYLNTLIYEYAGLNTNKYVEFLKDLKKDIPVFTLKGYRDKDGKTYEIDDKNSPYYEKIKEYKILQYYFMFEK